MTVVRTSTKSRISKEISRPGGITASVAIQRAQAALDAKQDEFVEMIDSILTDLETSFSTGSSGAGSKDFTGLYRLASRILDIAFCLPESQIDKAAYALCELADRGEELAIWDQACTDVHIRTLKLLRHSGAALTKAQRLHMVAGLRQATNRRLGSRPAPPTEPGA